MMETFQDIADPTCVRLVNPADLAASFVTGVWLKSVTLEVTDEAVVLRLAHKHTECLAPELCGLPPIGKFSACRPGGGCC